MAVDYEIAEPVLRHGCLKFPPSPIQRFCHVNCESIVDLFRRNEQSALG